MARPPNGPLPQGRMQIAFALLLVLALGLGAVPVVRHTQKTYRAHRRIERLATSPLEAQVAAFAGRLTGFEARAAEFHELLTQVEELLWVYRNRREPALILKDFGDKSGRIGLELLQGQFHRLRDEGIRLRHALAETALQWRGLRLRRGEAQYQALTASLDRALAAAGRHDRHLGRYGGLLDGVARRIEKLQTLAPQVADPVPRALRDLPGRLAPLRGDLQRLRGALPKAIRKALPPDKEGG